MKQYIISLFKLYLVSVVLLDIVIIFTPDGYMGLYSHIAYWILMIPVFVKFNPVFKTKGSIRREFAFWGLLLGFFYAIKNYVFGDAVLFGFATVSHYILLPIVFCSGEGCWGFNVAMGSTIGILLSTLIFAIAGTVFEKYFKR